LTLVPSNPYMYVQYYRRVMKKFITRQDIENIKKGIIKITSTSYRV